MWSWNEDKRQTNLAKHGVDFNLIDEFDWLSAVIRVDDRFDYGEVRLKAEGLIAGRLYAVVYTERGLVKRIINLRKANKREVLQWISQKK